MLKLILPVVVQQDLLLECKPLADWLKDDILLDKGKYILGTNSDPFLLAVEKVLMDHRMVIHNNNLPGCWVTPPSTQIIATGSDVLIDQELGSMRRAQEVAVADKKTPKMWWGGGWSRSLSFCVSLVSSCWSLSFPPPPIYSELAVGKGDAQVHIILQNALMAYCLEAGAATTTALIVTPTFAQDIGAMDFA